MKSQQGVIYYLYCLVTDKGYIGQSVQHEKRWQVHINAAAAVKPTLLIHRAVKKHGVENFTAEVVRTCKIEDLNRLETYYIKKYHTFVDDPKGGGYNLTLGGGFCTQAKDVIARRAASLRKAYVNDPTLRHRTGGAHKGKTVSAEVREKIAASHRGVKLSDTHVAALKQSHASGVRKITHTKAWGEKVSVSLLHRYATDVELRQRLSSSHKGMKFSEEHKRNLSKHRKAVMARLTPEQRREFALKGVAGRRAKAAARLTV